MYQLFGTSSWVRTRTTPGTSSAALSVDVLQQRVVALGPVHLQVQHPGRVDVLEELRPAGDVPERVGALDRRADDVEVAVALARRSSWGRAARVWIAMRSATTAARRCGGVEDRRR